MSSILFTIPKELLSEIWSWLHDHDLKSLARVCKQFYTIWDTVTRVELRRFTDQTEIQPFLKKQKFGKAQYFKIRGHWKLKFTVIIENDIMVSLNGKQLISLDLDCRLFPNPEKSIREMTSLQHVRLYYKRFGEPATLDFATMFPNHPHLTSFSLKRSDLVRVQGWQFVKNLRSLELCRGGDGVFFMPRGTYFEFPENTLTNLTKLGTEFFSFENPDAFKVLSNLVELELLHTKVGDIDAKRALFDLPNLVSLHWQNTQELNEQTLESMAKMTHLTKLFILEGDDYFEYYDTSFHGVNNMTHLKQLAIIDRADVSGLTNLEKLRLSHQAAKSIRSAEKLPKLVDLSLTDSSFYKEEQFILTTLCNMTNLTKLLFAVRLRGEENTRPFLLDNLSKLTNLRHLEIMPLENEDEPARCADIINAISSITSLRILHLCNAAYASVPEMSKLTQLQMLKVMKKPNFDTCHIPLNIPIEFYSVGDVDELHGDVN